MGYQLKSKVRRKRRRHDDELPPQLITHNAVSDVQRALKNQELMNQPDTILSMQNVMGNQAVQRTLKTGSDKTIQRMPTRSQVVRGFTPHVIKAIKPTTIVVPSFARPIADCGACSCGSLTTWLATVPITEAKPTWINPAASTNAPPASKSPRGSAA